MEMLNEWLREIQATGQGVELYNFTGVICTVLLFSSILLYTWRLRLNPVKAIVIGYLTNVFLGYAQHLITWYQRDFEWNRFIGTGNIGYAFILLPIFCWLCDKTFNTPNGFSGELAAITTLAWHFVGRSGCTFAGCCRGIDCSWGVYSQYAEGNTFPVCWLESLLSLGILIFLVMRMLRRGYLPDRKTSRYHLVNWYYSKGRVLDDGRALPYLLFFYGSGRFVTEFLRYHPTDDILFGFLPEFSVIALIMALLGGCLLFSLDKENQKTINDPEDAALPVLKGRRH